MLASVSTFAVHGIDSRRVTVEVDIPGGGLSAFTIVGLPDTSVREARDRVHDLAPSPEGIYLSAHRFRND